MEEGKEGRREGERTEERVFLWVKTHERNEKFRRAYATYLFLLVSKGHPPV
jgi:hypothetical protein